MNKISAGRALGVFNGYRSGFMKQLQLPVFLPKKYKRKTGQNIKTNVTV
jgi:hypothetical protein